jgi:hypothetical protein
MRELVAVLAVVFLLILPPAAHASAPDGVNLSAARGPSAGQVMLGWNGTMPSYTVYRSSDPATVASNAIGNTATKSFVDSPPAGLSFYLVVGHCPTGEAACFGLCAADTDADTYCDRQDYCATDPQKVDRGQCGCFKAENTGDTDGDGVINCHDQCLGYDDRIDTDRGGLADACDPCPTGACPLTLPDRFYAELPNHRPVHVSRDGRWIGAIDPLTGRGYLIPTAQLLANPLDTSYYEPLGDETVADIRALSDDGNLVLANIETYVPQAASSTPVIAAAIYDRTNGNWRVLGLRDEAIDIDACRYYSNAGDMTSDGKVVFGRTPSVESPCSLVGFRHDVGAGTWQLFGGPEGEVHQVMGASGDGRRIVGSEDFTIGGEHGVIWNDQPPGSFSPQGMTGNGTTYDVTFDGSAASVTSSGRAQRWTATGGLEQLGAGTLNPNSGVKAVAISDGGNIVVGYHVYLGGNSLPFIWVDTLGFGNLRSYLVFRGHTQLGGFDDNYIPLDVSGDGRVIVGRDAGAFSGLPGWVVVTKHQ